MAFNSEFATCQAEIRSTSQLTSDLTRSIQDLTAQSFSLEHRIETKQSSVSAASANAARDIASFRDALQSQQLMLSA